MKLKPAIFQRTTYKAFKKWLAKNQKNLVNFDFDDKQNKNPMQAIEDLSENAQILTYEIQSGYDAEQKNIETLRHLLEDNQTVKAYAFLVAMTDL